MSQKRPPVMKNAPKIDLGAATTVPNNAPSQQPVAPAVAKLSDRVRGMAPGNTITQTVCGRDVTFTLKVIPAEHVSKATMVWAGNERDQELLSESALADLIPSFQQGGQQFPAYGRDIHGITEVADGSRRRRTAIVTKRDYQVLVGDLDDEQMAWLSQIGNDYRPTSAFERGKRYARRLQNEFDGNISKLAEAENISRKIITRCMATAELPSIIITLFANPNELSARAGEALAKHYKANEDAVEMTAISLANRKIRGEALDTDDIISLLHECGGREPKPVTVRTFGSGIKVTTKPTGVAISLKKVPDELLKKIEALLEEHEKEQQELARNEVHNSMAELENVVATIRAAAAVEKYDIPDNVLQGMIPAARSILENKWNEESTMKEIRRIMRERYIA